MGVRHTMQPPDWDDEVTGAILGLLGSWVMEARQMDEPLRTALDGLESIEWSLSVDDAGTYSGPCSMNQFRSAMVVLMGPGGYSLEMLSGVELELRKALDNIAAHRASGAPTPDFLLTVEDDE